MGKQEKAEEKKEEQNKEEGGKDEWLRKRDRWLNC
jgi:hypothetical protein